MPAPKELTPEASMWHLFGAHLRQYRKAAGMTQQQLGRRLHSTGAFVGQIETAERKPHLEFAADLDRVLGACGALAATAYHALRLAEGQPGWFETFAQAEQEAARIRTFQPQVIPGLLQCEQYMRALLQIARFPQPTIETSVARRLARAKLLTKKEAPAYWAAVDEAALLRLRHDPTVAKAQLEHLLAASEMPNIVLEIVPMSCGLHPCMDGALVMLSIPARGECAYEDGMFEGQMITDTHSVGEVQRRYDLLRAEALSPSRSQRLLRDLLEST